MEPVIFWSLNVYNGFIIVTRQYRDECNALEPGNRASDAALEAELASFEELALKPKIGTFWEKNPNFMERVKQHKPVKRKEEPARQNQGRSSFMEGKGKRVT